MKHLYIPDLKKHRTNVIKRYLDHDRRDVIILSCGNAYSYLKKALPQNNVIGLSTSRQYPDCVKLENRYYTSRELKELYPNSFNATPGMLPPYMYKEIGLELMSELSKQNYSGDSLMVPCGSGETLVALDSVLSNHSLGGYYDPNIPEICFDYTTLRDVLMCSYELVNLNDRAHIKEHQHDMWMITLTSSLHKISDVIHE